MKNAVHQLNSVTNLQMNSYIITTASGKVIRCRALYAGTDKLRADYIQMAHHGQNGVDRRFYEAVAPTGCLWCTPDWLWNNDVGGGFNTHVFQAVTVRGWMDEMGVREHYVMMNGVQVLEL